MDGIVLRCGVLKASGGMIEQVKGASYSVTSLLGWNPFLPTITEGKTQEVNVEEENGIEEDRTESLSMASLASAEVRNMSAPTG